MIRENNREMAALLKEERKRERAASKQGGVLEPSYAPSSSDSRGDYVPPSMRRQQAQA